MSEEIRVRFAPSPTGHVHIGNIRVCIYNWLFARNKGGRMLLRVEDTDQERSTSEALNTLFSALEWMGLDYDEEPVYQSSRLERHHEVCDFLIENGYAYYSAKGDESKGEALLFKVSEDASYTDLILGERSKAAADIADFVILKSDRTPVFHLANVVDDIDMGISHIFRGNDHIESTFRHVMIYKALGEKPPSYAHFPMIVNNQGKPYSKRDGDAYVGDFRNKGYMPEALFNFLALCGWSPGDDREVIPREEMIELFSVERVKSSPAQFNQKKMDWMNKEYIKRLSEDELIAKVSPEVSRAGYDMNSLPLEKQKEIVSMYKDRITTLNEFPESAGFFFSDDFEYEEKGISKFILGPECREIFEALHAILEQADSFDEETLTPPFQKLMEEKEIGFLKIAQPLRVAITGTTKSPGIFETLVSLGRDKVLMRMKRIKETFYKE